MTETNGNNVKDWVIRSEAPKSVALQSARGLTRPHASSRGTSTDYMGVGRRCLASICEGLRYSRAIVEIQWVLILAYKYLKVQSMYGRILS